MVEHLVAFVPGMLFMDVFQVVDQVFDIVFLEGGIHPGVETSDPQEQGVARSLIFRLVFPELLLTRGFFNNKLFVCAPFPGIPGKEKAEAQ